MTLPQNTYDQYADEYADLLQTWKDSAYSHYHSLVIPQVRRFVGEVAGLTVLDAGCGEGYLARLLTEQGAHVTAVDVSARLVELAQRHEHAGNARYMVQDLSKGLPNHHAYFDLVVSNFVLNEVADYVGYIDTLGAVTKVGGRVILAFNNPYAVVFREKAQSYFDKGAVALYQSLSKAGVRVYHYHQTFEDYMTAFRNAGFLLRGLADLHATRPIMTQPIIEEAMPFIIVLELVKIKLPDPEEANLAWE